MSVISAARGRTAALLVLLALIGAALLSVPVFANASATGTPYPPKNPSSGAVAPTEAHQSSSTVGTHQGNSNNGGTSTTGFATVAATAIALTLIGGGLFFIVAGRRRRA